MNNPVDIKDWYLSNFGEFEKRLNGGKENSIHQKRKTALSNFSKLEFPTILFDEMEHSLIVFINGRVSTEHTDLLNLPEGVVVGSVEEQTKKQNENFLKHFGKYADDNNHIFTALSTAYTDDGAFIFVPAGKIVEEPIRTNLFY
ncbi:MAG: hypothetical protein DYG97_06475 [Ignavibacteria bacterium CHB3]|nr:hypothetical protein [Ignavibacteria bacterium CHB3]